MSNKNYLLIALAFMISHLTYGQVTRYKVCFSEPSKHFLEVEMTIEDAPKGTHLDLHLPVWTPGSYLVREFAKSVEGFSASANGQPVAFDKVDKSTWRLAHKKGGPVSVRYRIHAFEHTVRTSIVDSDHAYLNGPSVFMYVKALKDKPYQVSFEPYAEWKVISTALEQDGESPWSRKAANYDELVDAPIEIGNHEVRSFEVEGIRHDVALVGPSNVDPDRLLEGMEKIVKASNRIFGKNPCNYYLFIIHFTNGKGGGLEHSNSTTCFADRLQFSSQSGYDRFFGLVAHEYFHLWNVKRLRPKVLGPFDYQGENYTDALWIVEGFTSYFDEKILRMAGIYSESEYLGRISSNISRVENNPGWEIQPVAEASFDAWIKYYRQDQISPNSFVSYYSRGAALATLLDLMIINKSGGEQDLGDLMAEAYQRFYEKRKAGYTDEEFKALLEEYTGQSLDEFYRDYVHGTEPIAYASYFEQVGIRFVEGDQQRLALGVTLEERQGRLIISKITRGSAAWDSDLNFEDEVIAVDGWRMLNQGMLAEYLLGKEEGDELRITVARKGQMREVLLTLKPLRNTYVMLRLQPDPDKDQRKKRAAFLVEQP